MSTLSPLPRMDLGFAVLFLGQANVSTILERHECGQSPDAYTLV